jgi:hypothetical protein
MKRLILLTLILVPVSLATLKHPDRSRHWHHRGASEAVAADPDTTFPEDGGLVRTEVRSLPMATEERATLDVRHRAEILLAKRLESYGVPAGWMPPPEAIDSVVTPGAVESSVRDYGTVYIRSAQVDDRTPQLRRLAHQYERQVASRRLLTLGGGLAFALFCLATLSGYIHADEATRGYYTRRLRAFALAAVGASGVVLYRWLA